MIISQGHHRSLCVKCELLFLIRFEQKAGCVAFFFLRPGSGTIGERTVGDGEVQIALPGHLPRFIYGMLRCKNITTGLLFTAHFHSNTASDLSELQKEDNSGVIYYCAMLHSHRLPTKCGSVTLSLEAWI